MSSAKKTHFLIWVAINENLLLSFMALQFPLFLLPYNFTFDFIFHVSNEYLLHVHQLLLDYSSSPLKKPEKRNVEQHNRWLIGLPVFRRSALW